MEKDILTLNIVIASQDSHIPTKIIKKNLYVFSGILFKEFNESLEICKFTLVHKRGNRSDKDNYRPVSILPSLSKNFEKSLRKQISTFFEDILF